MPAIRTEIFRKTFTTSPQAISSPIQASGANAAETDSLFGSPRRAPASLSRDFQPVTANPAGTLTLNDDMAARASGEKFRDRSASDASGMEARG